MKRLVAIGALAPALVIASAGAAGAYFKAAGTGTGAAATAALAAPALSVPASATNTVAVTFAAQGSLQPASSSDGQIAYTVQRRLGGGAYADVASGDCAGAKGFGTASCTDSPPSSGSYSYRAIASYRSWTATSAETSSVTVSVDTAPAVQSIARLDPDPSSAGSVRWTVTFSEPVTGVGAADFALAQGGSLSGGSISSVSGSGATYTVTASSGTGSGTLGLNLVDDDSIADAAGNPLGGTGAANGDFTGHAYTVDRTAPARTAMAMLDTNANGKVDRVTVTFGETLAASTATAPWTLANVPSGGTLASVSTSGAAATLTLDEGAGASDTGAGAFSVALAASATGIRDSAGNQASFAAAAPADGAAPVRTAMSMFDANRNGKVDQVTVTFTETVATPVVATAFTFASTPSAGSLGAASASTNVVTLTVSEGAGAASTAVGAFTIALAASATGVRDSAGNQASFAAAAPADKAGPVPIAMSDTDGATDGRIETANTIGATFSEPVASGLPASTAITEAGAAGANDKLTIGGFTNGALDMSSANYVLPNQTVTFAGTSALSGGGATITITAGACMGGTCGSERNGSGKAMAYVPAPTLLDAAGNAAGGSFPTNFKIF